MARSFRLLPNAIALGEATATTEKFSLRLHYWKVVMSGGDAKFQHRPSWRHDRAFPQRRSQCLGHSTRNLSMTIQEILKELPKLTLKERRQLWKVLNHEMADVAQTKGPLINEKVRLKTKL
jgi:hypothetical protein